MLTKKQVKLLDRLLVLAEDENSAIGKALQEDEFVKKIEGTDEDKPGPLESELNDMRTLILDLHYDIKQLYSNFSQLKSNSQSVYSSLTEYPSSYMPDMHRPEE